MTDQQPAPAEPTQWDRCGWQVKRPTYYDFVPEGQRGYEDLLRVSDGRVWFLLDRELYDDLDDTAFTAIAEESRRRILERPQAPGTHTPGALATPPTTRRFARKDITDAQVIAACSHGGGTDSLSQLMQDTGAPRKVCLAAMQRALRRDLIEYGVCIERAWSL